MSAVTRGNRRPPCPRSGLRQRRLDILLYGLLLIACLPAGRLAYVQVINRSHYLARAAQLERGRVETPRRGGIYASDLTPLAESVRRLSLCANPVALRGKGNGSDLTVVAADGIAAAFGLNRDQILGQLRADAARGKTFTYLQRFLTEQQAAGAKVLDEKRPWTRYVWTQTEWQRLYPERQFACHVVGRCTAHEEPKEGLEAYWDFVLQGTPGASRSGLDAFGRRILRRDLDPQDLQPPRDGLNLILTLDPEIQSAAEEAVDRCMRVNRPKTATCVVLDANTSAILASASRPGYDPAHIPACSPEELRARLCNAPVSRAYEPGSVLKVLLVAALLETGACPPDKTFYCGGTMELGGKPLGCWGPWRYNGGHHNCDMTRMLAQSCNLAAAQFALTLKRTQYYKFLRGCGITVPMRTGMPAEARGSLPRLEELTVRDQANLGFGQGVMVTDIQVANAIAAVVNGGRLMQPHIVRALADPTDNHIVREIPPVQIGTACSPQTSAKVRRMMGAVVTEGTGRPAFISEEMPVGGKTGTAQKYDKKSRRYLEGRNLVSFVLVAPLDQPRFVVLFTADEPRCGGHGSDVAAPRAREVAMAALRDAGLLSVETEIKMSGDS